MFSWFCINIIFRWFTIKYTIKCKLSIWKLYCLIIISNLCLMKWNNKIKNTRISIEKRKLTLIIISSFDSKSGNNGRHLTTTRTLSSFDDIVFSLLKMVMMIMICQIQYIQCFLMFLSRRILPNGRHGNRCWITKMNILDEQFFSLSIPSNGTLEQSTFLTRIRIFLFSFYRIPLSIQK